jgi:hypothetical protein
VIDRDFNNNAWIVAQLNKARPRHKRANPPNMLAAMYNADVHQAPLLTICHMSLAKVENVVNPPQNPVISRVLTAGDTMRERSTNPHRIPISRQPIRFTANVPAHAISMHTIEHHRPTAYRAHVPTNPPTPATSINFTILCDNSVLFDKKYLLKQTPGGRILLPDVKYSSYLSPNYLVIIVIYVNFVTR